MSISLDDAIVSTTAPLAAERTALLLLAGDFALARQLVQQLPNEWRVRLISPDAGATGPDAAESHDGPEPAVEIFRGEPTSAVMLQRAGAATARTVVTALADPDENLEVCRIAAQQLNVPNVIAVVPSTDAGVVDPYRALGAQVVVAAAVVATAVRNIAEPTSAAVQEVGPGQGELVQLTLQPSSPVVGRRLRAFRQRGWTVAVLFRGEELILPQPDTVLQAGDRLLLAGTPEQLSVIAEYLRVGRAQFPLPYGASIAGPVWGEPSEDFLREVAYLANGVGVREVTLSTCDHGDAWRTVAERLPLPVEIAWDSTALHPAAAVTDVVQRFSPGCLVMPAGRPRLPRPFAGLSAPLQTALATAQIPVLLPRGTFPYQQLFLPVFRSPLPPGPTQAALDLADHLGATLTTVHVQAPRFLEEHGDEPDAVAAAVDEMASLRRFQVQHERRVGNPLGELQQLAGPNRLIVLSHRRGRRWRSFRPDVSAYLAQRFNGSVLVQPVDG